MKTTTVVFLLLIAAATSPAQIKVDSNYTVLARGIDEKTNPAQFLFGDLSSLLIKENATGKTCSPVSMHFTLVVNGENFHIHSIAEAQLFINRMKPKDVIYIENIKLPQDCFAPPRQIMITVM